jgi:hypothetical protein
LRRKVIPVAEGPSIVSRVEEDYCNSAVNGITEVELRERQRPADDESHCAKFLRQSFLGGLVAGAQETYGFRKLFDSRRKLLLGLTVQQEESIDVIRRECPV